MRKSKMLSYVGSLLFITALMCQSVFAQEKKTFVAFSMKVAQARVEQAVKQGIDWRRKQPDLFYLGGITRPWAVVLDAKTNDWILVGERDPKSSILTLDDWVVALRARFIHSEKDPGVTIDPVCPKGTIREGCGEFTRQEVRFFGGIENTHFGQVCYEADWLMKRIGLGLEKLPIEKLKTYYELLLGQHLKSGVGITNVGSRFWFYPIVNRVNVFGDVVLLEKLQMGVFTEVLYAEINGKPVVDVDKFEHYPSEEFSRSFSENYDATADVRAVLETLRGLTRLAALAKGLTEVDQKPSVEFYLRGYLMENVETPKQKDVLKAGNKEVGLEISGGVELMALALRLKGGDVSALKELVIGTRSSEGILSWGFDMEMRDGQLKGVELPPGVTDPSQIVPLFQQALFLQEKKRYDAAIEAYGRILEISPNDVPAAYINRGGAYVDGKREYDLGIADFNKAIALNQNLAEAYNNRGVAYKSKGLYDRAIQDFDRAILLKPNYAAAYYNRGLDRAEGKKEYDLAIVDFTKAIALKPNYIEAYIGRGIAFCDGRHEFDLSIADFNKAIALNPSCAECYYNRGTTYNGEGLYDHALQDYDRAIALNPKHAEAYNNRGVVYKNKGLYDRAIQDLDRAIALNQNYTEAYSNRGVAYKSKGLYDRAIQDHDRAIALNPTFPEVYVNRGLAYEGNADYDRAIQDYDKALLINPNYALAYFNKGVACEGARRVKEAFVAYQKFVELSTPQYALHIQYARERIRMLGRWQK